MGCGDHYKTGCPIHARSAWVGSDLARATSRWAYLLWAALACAVLTKGLVAIVFVFATLAVFLTLTGDWRRWRSLHPFTGHALFLAIAAPWHILAALRNPAVPMPANSGFPAHAGWTWFYLYNEHIARFLGTRVPRDYNKLPAALYWALHIVWLFPWSLFFPAAIALAWTERDRLRQSRWSTLARTSFAARTVLLLTIFSAIILGFFSLSTNQEYYTFPVYLPLLILTAAALAHIEAEPLTSIRAGRHLRPRRPHHPRPRHRRRARLRPLDLTPPRLRPRHRLSARPSRRRRLHALHVPLLRPHRPILRRASSPRRTRRHRLRHRPAHRLDAPHAPPRLRLNLHHRPHRGHIPHRRAHRTRPLRAHALLARFRHNHPAARIQQLHRTQHRSHALRRSGLRLLHPLLPRPPRLTRRRPQHLHALRQPLPRRPTPLPHTQRPRSPNGDTALAKSSSSPSNTATTSTTSSAHTSSSSTKPPAKPSSPTAPSILSRPTPIRVAHPFAQRKGGVSRVKTGECFCCSLAIASASPGICFCPVRPYKKSRS